MDLLQIAHICKTYGSGEVSLRSRRSWDVLSMNRSGRSTKMKRRMMICSVLACTLLLCACSAPKSWEDTCKSALQKVGDGLIDIGKTLKEGQSSEKDAPDDDKTWEDAVRDVFQGVESGLSDLYKMFHDDSSAQNGPPTDAAAWESAYRSILREMDSNLADPYGLRAEPNICIYAGVHDFDGDGVPELVAGDCVSAAVFTYRSGTAEKIADLYEPESWGSFSALHCKGNTLVLVTGGSDGNSYVCFTFQEGTYLSGTYDEYNPNTADICGEQVSEEDFEGQFAFDGLSEETRIAYIQRTGENSLIINGIQISVDNLDFRSLEW